MPDHQAISYFLGISQNNTKTTSNEKWATISCSVTFYEKKEKRKRNRKKEKRIRKKKKGKEKRKKEKKKEKREKKEKKKEKRQRKRKKVVAYTAHPLLDSRYLPPHYLRCIKTFLPHVHTRPPQSARRVLLSLLLNCSCNVNVVAIASASDIRSTLAFFSSLINISLGSSFVFYSIASLSF